MRKILLLSVLLISFTCVKAQYYQLGFDSVRVKSKFKLGNVSTGSATDSVLVKKGNGGVFKVSRASFGVPADSLTFRTVANSLTLSQLQTRFDLYQTIANLSTDLTASATKYPSVNAVNTGLGLKANLASPTLTGTPSAPTATAGTNTTQIATTAFAQSMRQSGWVQYSDNVYTLGSPLVINQGVTDTLTNNASVSITTQLPDGVTSLYNPTTNKITPQLDGDSYLINVRFNAVSSSTSGLIDVGVDVGGTLNIIAQETVSLRKGVGNSQRVNLVFDVYTGSTFIANGGLIKLTSIDGNTSISDIFFKITRTHKAR